MLTFIDESGHPRPTDNTKRPVLLAACIQEANIGRLARAMFAKRRAAEIATAEDVVDASLASRDLDDLFRRASVGDEIALAELRRREEIPVAA